MSTTRSFNFNLIPESEGRFLSLGFVFDLPPTLFLSPWVGLSFPPRKHKTFSTFLFDFCSTGNGASTRWYLNDWLLCLGVGVDMVR